ncbi:MAG: tripartite tricarboxylate transporter TctB family protein [Sphaerochaetaceae bacterium]
MWQKYKDLIGSSVVSIFGLFFFLSSFSIRKYGDMAINSRSFPQILGILVMVFGLVQILQSVKVLTAKDSNTDQNIIDDNQKHSENSPISMKNVIFTIVLMITYAFLMKPLGFLISTFLYSFIQAFILYPNKKKNFLIMILVSCIFTGLVYIVFVKGFSLVLPQGLLG